MNNSSTEYVYVVCSGKINTYRLINKTPKGFRIDFYGDGKPFFVPRLKHSKAFERSLRIFSSTIATLDPKEALLKAQEQIDHYGRWINSHQRKHAELSKGTD